VFDYLRQEGGSETTHLLDIYTYTTAISVCSSSQQLERALELAAEMRSRGISCNVHTYSALMNVCIKSNEVQLAQEVYKQMLEEGCTPNLVTFNTLIDLYVKTGQWQEAIGVLDTLEQHVSGFGVGFGWLSCGCTVEKLQLIVPGC
jgi:pentatricopeptide repeat domain-containing protein 1